MTAAARTLCLLLLAALLGFSSCEVIPQDPVSPSDCGYTLPRLIYSKPAACAPTLLTFSKLNDGMATGEKMPPLPEDCTAVGRTQVAYLDGIKDGEFFLDVYKGAPGPIALSVYGEVSCGEVVSLLECTQIGTVASRFPISTQGRNFSKFFVRFTIDADANEEAQKYDPNYTVRLAAYDDDNAIQQRRGIQYSKGASTVPSGNQTEDGLPLLNFDCSGTAFQRIVLSACEEDSDVLRAWVRELGVTPAEEYYGEKGNVVVFDVPPGMDLNTTGGSAREVRAKVNGGDGTAEPDYLINLFNPRNPATIVPPSQRVRTVTNDPVLKDVIPRGAAYFGELLPPFRLPASSTQDPVQVITIIDSGVDLSDPNARLWSPFTYQQRKETQFIKTNHLGADFIAKDLVPNDLTPHGTYVAGAFLGNYRGAEAGLNVVHMKIFGAEGISTYFGALVALYEANAIGSTLINMSWGLQTDREPEALACAVTAAVREGIFLVTSAGNDTLNIDDRPQWPAAFAATYPEHVLTTASYWYRGWAGKRDPADIRLMHFSNFGRQRVSLAAYMTTPVPDYGRNAIIYPLGTSISTPIVAGQLAGFLAKVPGGRLREFRQNYLGQTSTLTGQINNGNYLPLHTSGK